MPGQRRHRDNDPVPDHHVVANMAARQDIVVRPDHRRLAVAGGAVNGNAFPDGVVVADLGPGHPALPFQVLGSEPDARKGVDLIPLAQPRVAVNHHVRKQPAARTDFYVLPDNAVRSDFTVIANARLRMDNRCRMNHIASLSQQ